MFERRDEDLAPIGTFINRLIICLALSGILMMIGLLIGITGYHYIAGLPWIDAVLNASMILGGMGPVDDLKTDNAKLFASVYALFSGLILVAATGIIISPILHRVLHKFHLEDED
jgi:hypothetical protein